MAPPMGKRVTILGAVRLIHSWSPSYTTRHTHATMGKRILKRLMHQVAPRSTTACMTAYGIWKRIV